MEEELRCPSCKQFFNNPVLLPCYHALCLNCAVHLQQPAHGNASSNGSATSASSENAESVASGSSGGDYQESDKLSILSETDSGVVCTSRPNSYVGTPNGVLYPSALSLACPVCHKLVYFDENGAHNLPKYRVMQSIVDKYGEARNLTLKCQMCENEPAGDATVMCEQCEVLYCESCRESCHPTRGPLAKHNLVEPKRGAGGAASKGKDGRCPEHADEALNMYCLVCKVGVCALCLMDSRHASHDVQALAIMCKAQKSVKKPPCWGCGQEKTITSKTVAANNVIKVNHTVDEARRIRGYRPGPKRPHYLPGPERICAVLNRPEEDWMRKQKRHYSNLLNRSQIYFGPPLPSVRVYMTSLKRRSENRHYCGAITRSHLDAYF